MAILVTGADGYIGWPVMLRLAREFPNERVVGVDNLGRRRWVEEVGSVSAIPVCTVEERLRAGYDNLSFVSGDLVERDLVRQLYSTYLPRVVIHLAAQPSAPYSEINGERASFTQFNNSQSTRNLLWGLNELNLPDTLYIQTTTIGTYGQPTFDIPEGYMDVTRNGRNGTIIFPGMASDWYHMSKFHDVCNLWLANRQWKLSILDLRTAIVYGTKTEETQADPRLSTRFDFDFYFGTVINRFVAQAVAGYPITVYGTGGLRRPMIGLQDCVDSIAAAARREPDGRFEIYNQTSGPVSIGDMAAAIQDSASHHGLGVEIEHLPNPRVEEEEHQMVMENSRFMSELLPSPRQHIQAGVHEILESLVPYRDVITQYKDRFVPEALLRRKSVA